MQKQITVQTSSKKELVDITKEVEGIVKKSGIKEGICNVFVHHATAAIVINENADPDIQKDLLELLEKLIPEGRWRHDKMDNNAAAHLKSSVIGPERTIPISQSRLNLGQWQDIFLCEFDGPRERNITVTIIRD